MIPHDPDDAVPLLAQPLGPATARLRAAVPDLWSTLGAMCRPLEREEVAVVASGLRGYLRGTPHADHAGELANELLALYAGWDHYTDDERAVLVGAMTYLVTSDDAAPDHGPFGLDDDDRVIRACVRVLLRREAA